MTIQELIEYQNSSGHICLIKQGLFFRGYNQGAILLNTLFGYMIKQKEVSYGRIHYVGFPASVINKIIERVMASNENCRIVRREENNIEFSGCSIDYDQEVAAQVAVNLTENHTTKKDKSRRTAKPSNPIATAILDFDISHSTPLDALHLIADLQKELKCSMG